ncbi:hypothetical protein EYF80_052500 [Liparis tanakae]|uniref:Uncharacterized protein n=1 Tax=Liparis tanakae TaxID=230148 RepID=A0A4Z2F965_9TELE|nr:hypothetical protein EYF80_052500 [Liparis tanakae]
MAVGANREKRFNSRLPCRTPVADTTVNSSSDVQWTEMVSYDAVHNSSRMHGAFGAAEDARRRKKEENSFNTI